MQFLIDTATDSPQELYKIGRFLVDQFSVVPAEQPELPNIDEIGQDAGAAIKSGPLTYAAAQSIADANTARAAAIKDGPLPFVPNAEHIPAVVASVSHIVPPPPPLTISDVVGDNDPEVEFDDAGNVTAVTVSTELPAAPPPPPRPPSIAALVPAATPAPPGPAVAAELDTAGFPWDNRIHAANRSKTIKGTWKAKRGVDAATIVAVEAQNKPGNVPSSAAPTPTAIAASVVTLTAAVPPPPPAVPPSPGVPSAAIGSVAPSTGIATTPLDFRGLMQKIQKATADGKLTADQVNAALAGVGLKPEEMAQLINNAPLIASVNAAVEAYLA